MINYAFLLSHPEEFIRGFSYYYPVPKRLLERYEGIWDWGKLSRNTNLEWSEALLLQFEANWDWSYLYLCANEGLPWSPALYRRFAHRWKLYHLRWAAMIKNNAVLLSEVEQVFENDPAPDWSKFSELYEFPWTNEFISRHADKLDWENLSANDSLPWNPELIAQHADKWDWDSLSFSRRMPWSLDLLKKFEDRWSWYMLSANTSIKWTDEMLVTFKDRLCWVSTSTYPGDYIGEINGLYNNRSILWTPALYESCNAVIEDQFRQLAEDKKEELEESDIVLLEENQHWTVYQDGANWSEAYFIMLKELNEKFPGKQFIDWKLFGSLFNSWQTWSRDTVQYCLERIDIYDLVGNADFPWAEHPAVCDRLSDYQQDWHGWIRLSVNGFQLTEAIIERYQDNWDWDLLSANPCLTTAIVNKFAHRWDWRKIFANDSIATESILDHINDDFEKWWWVKGRSIPFGEYDNFACLLAIPSKGKIEQHISVEELETFLEKIVSQPADEFRKIFRQALDEGRLDYMFPGIQFDGYYPFLLEYADEIMEKEQSAGFVQSLADKAFKLLLAKRYSESISLFRLALHTKTGDRVRDLSLYCNALYVLQHDNTGLPVDQELNHAFLAKCLPHGPQNPAIYFNAACLYMEMNDTDKVYECIQLAKKYQFSGYADMIREIRNAPMFEGFVKEKRFEEL